jgi:hypothetical protein
MLERELLPYWSGLDDIGGIRPQRVDSEPLTTTAEHAIYGGWIASPGLSFTPSGPRISAVSSQFIAAGAFNLPEAVVEVPGARWTGDSHFARRFLLLALLREVRRDRRDQLRDGLQRLSGCAFFGPAARHQVDAGRRFGGLGCCSRGRDAQERARPAGCAHSGRPRGR